MGDFDFWYPVDTLLSFYWAWKASDGKLTPDGKAWIEQDAQWWEDIYVLDAIYQDEYDKLKAKKKKPSE